MYYTSTRNSIVYVCIPIRVPPPTGTEWIFLIFEGWFLEVPQAVLFHATATHCHHARDIKYASFFVLE